MYSITVGLSGNPQDMLLLGYNVLEEYMNASTDFVSVSISKRTAIYCAYLRLYELADIHNFIHICIILRLRLTDTVNL